MTDLLVKDEGTIFLLIGNSSAGNDWLKDRVDSVHQTWCKSIVVEHRYIADIINGAVDDGLTVQNI